MLLVPHEFGVLKYICICFTAYFLEVIHVQLSDEGCEFVMLEILRQDFIGEFNDILDFKRFTIVRPRYEFKVIFITYYMI